MSSEFNSERAISEDNGRTMDGIEKKRAQNRLAQRNYRRNVKQRIRELEEQVATQASMLTLLSGHTETNMNINSLALTPNMNEHGSSGGLGASNEYENFDPQCTFPVPDVLEARSAYSSGSNGIVTNDEVKRASNCAAPALGSETPSSHMNDSDRIYSAHKSIDTMATTPSSQSARSASTSSWSYFNSNTTSSVDASTRTPPASTLEAKIERIIQVAKDSGFESFDAAICCYYTAKFELPACLVNQQSSRTHQLPELLGKIRVEIQNWEPNESHCYRQEIHRSSEQLLLSDLLHFHKSAGKDLLALMKSYMTQQVPIDWKHLACLLQTEVS
ncbi:uncharacterized protein BCR38DRAFT_54315 [Pseudomassariella vexata]|uniref:BZIP domain-containing protein n=1 Tax=Pseudomassariella vexata TaxID=1141098 RepID=A0A1Y2DLJ9_9PEZI|nr:uncharacterized protein BCR38DRAFT_54315 [Pseudomassariella vexata]ORY60127.1 hypothetical protein BCR38DRAFT_54315 [Pseudomassariella vexata]